MNVTQTIGKLEQIAKDIELFDKEANDRILELEREQEQGYEKFNTKTHILIERKFLQDIGNAVESITNDAGCAVAEAEELECYSQNLRSYCGDVETSSDNIQDDIRQLLQSEDE